MTFNINELAETDPRTAAVFMTNLLRNLKETEGGISEEHEQKIVTAIAAPNARHRTKEVVRKALLDVRSEKQARARKAKRQARRRVRK